MKKLFVLVMLVAIVGCSSMTNQLSVCDTITQPSYLCEIANKNNIRIEDVGNILMVANLLAIDQGVYTTAQALSEMKSIRDFLDNPVSYLAVLNLVTDSTSKYPGLFIVASIYIKQFNSSRIMYSKDQAILRSWLDLQIETLG
ncbi:hypothetical protein KAR91_56485 [Candidatus Pacearchaeota archaeon]|nr:hypothetical protein [Candidatus Pacearchaeota archaeon]